MAAQGRLGSVKRFGARYGRSLKNKFAKIEAVQHGEHICPYCHSKKVKRLALGIWKCPRCMAKFAGKAYSVKESIEVEETEEKEMPLSEEAEEAPEESEETEQEE